MPSSDVGIRPEDVRAFWSYMQQRFGTRVLNKQSAIEMRLVARALELLGIQSQGEFLRRYTTTIGRRIYTPFTVGVADSTYSLWDQLVVCVHEHQHVAQYDRNGLSFQLSYLFNSAARAQWEAEGYRSDLELHFWRYGETPPVRPIAERLFAYGCNQQDVEVAAKSLALSATAVRRGAIINYATTVALSWLNEHLPQLRARGVS